jgi:non-structural maintenance of chromosomes element 4
VLGEMARLTKMSESPDPGFGSDIYNASPLAGQRQVVPNDTTESPSPRISNSSDKENSSRHSGSMEKGKGRANMPPPKLPTPQSDVDRSGKRKRTNRESIVTPHSRVRRRIEPQQEDLDDFDRSYDPDQDVEERRRLRKELRDLARDLNDNRAEYLEPSSKGLFETLTKANEISSSVKQTTDATIDSRLLVTTADMSYRKTVQLTLGDSAQGLDTDEFVSKCITFMRRADGAVQDGPHVPSSTHCRRGRHNVADDDSDMDSDEGDMLNWEHLGRFACLQHNSRPSVPGFLLGPLSLERRARKPVQRRQGLKNRDLKQTQPEVIQAADIEKAENTNLTVLCSRILGRLVKVQQEGEAAVEAEATDDMTEDEIKALMDKHGVHAKGGVDLLKFVVNPYSFGQTVENLFYVSFLIRDGKAGITIDDDGLPAVGKSNLPQFRRFALTHIAQKPLNPANVGQLIRGLLSIRPFLPSIWEHGKI